jgi:release factor glutamine methyltransferase
MTAITVAQALAQSGLVPLDANVLLAHVLGRDRSWLITHRDDALETPRADEFFALARRRRDGEPVAYLTGMREFFGLPLSVSPDVLVPRPETETLVELALEWLPADTKARVLDLGTGSGAIALAIAHERPRVRVVATDASAHALAIARGNAQRLSLGNVEFVQADWYDAIGDRTFDVILSNPPYVAPGDPHLRQDGLQFEPSQALVAGDGGLAALREIIAGARAHLVTGGRVAVEHGFDQSNAVQAMLQENGFVDLVVRRDLAGIARVAGGRLAH